MPLLTYGQAIWQALDECLGRDPAVYLCGLGAPDPKGIFGTTLGLAERHGAQRVWDMPTSENALTGVAIGAALAGMRPVMCHQRLDFALLAMEELVNQAANWHFMYGGRMRVPLTVRLILGRGWGQGPQHSQHLQAWFAHVPGLKVVMPTTPHDAKGLLIAAIEDDNPVIFLEHRWLHRISGEVPAGRYTVPIGAARVARPGRDLTIAAISYMTLEALRAAEALAAEGVEAEVIDLRSLKPWDRALVGQSVARTGALLVADTGWKTAGFAAEVVAAMVEDHFAALRHPPARVTLPDCPTPTAPALAAAYYPRAVDIAAAARRMLGRPAVDPPAPAGPLDVPDPGFTGPF